MEKVLELYKYIDGVNDTPFPNKEEQIVLTSFRYDAKRMGGAPSITCTIIHDVCLDELWDENVYTTFRGEKYYIKNVASSSYSNTDTRYHHDAEFVSERVLLDNVYFYDVVDSESETDRPASNSSDFAFFGDINEFAKRLNQSFQYSGFEYRVVVDDDVESEDKLVSVQDKFISSVLQEIYNTYDIPYYFIGKEIHVGYVKDDIDYLFKYGEDESLLSIQKQNANNKIINRITGRGSADNIPYYYPNDDSKGEVSILYNGVAGNVTVVDAAKYKKVQLSDTFSYFEQESSKIPLLEDATPTINSTKVIPSTSELTQYRLDFSYSFTLETSGSVVLNIQSYLVNTTNIYYDVYDVGANTLLGRYLGYTELELDYGEYSIEVRWEFGISKAIGDDDGFLEVINQYITPTAELIKEAVSTWRFNGKNVELDDYGLSVNKTPSNGDSITFHLVSYIKTQTNLMPSIYRQTGGDERFYNALNQTYKDPSTGEYYVFDNPYTYGKAKEHIVDFDDIKPSIVGIRNASGARIDMFTDFAYDLNDNDDFDEEGNYKHPYFFGKLRRFDGEYGFNLFDHAIEEDEMVISMTSGSCGSCEWVIGVGSENQKNLVQVDDDGNLLRDEDGNVRCGRKGLQTETPQDRQNDTLNYEVWVALKKDFDTFNVLMPNAKHNYKPSTQDTFVILHIDLPKAYILSAEDKLTQSLIDYMAINNSEKFNFSISFSRIFFAENTNILTALDENSRIKIEYNGIVHTLYVSSYSYAVTDDNILPEVKVELVEALTITENAIQSAVSEVKLELSKQIKKTTDNSTNTNTSDIDAYIIGTNDSTNPTDKNVYSALRSDANYLKKTKDDRSVGTIASNKGFVVGTFQEGTLLGTGGSMFMREGSSYQEIDFLTVRKKATFTSIEVHELKHVGGEIILSSAAMICSNVEDTTIGYKCYFNKEDSDGRRVYQEFEVGDQARCQIFNLEPQADGTISSRYYWRLVIEVGEDYIVLSKTDCATGSDIPIKGDHICQMGNRDKTERQNAVLISAYGDDAPSYKQYTGIKSYSLEDAELVTKLSPTGNIIKGTFLLESGKNVQDELEGVKVNWDKVLTQTDKEFTMWFYPYSPSADNLPESEWTTDELRALHEEDLFYNTSTTDEDGGKAWRYVYDEASGTYLWELVTDAETIKALEKAAEAQKTADEVTEHLNEIVADGILSSLEKKEVLKEWLSVKDSYTQNIANVSEGGKYAAYNIDSSAYTAAFTALGSYLNGDTNDVKWDGESVPAWLDADKDENTTIDPSEYRNKWITYYNTEIVLLDNITKAVKDEADKAVQELTDIASDNVLSAVEKKTVYVRWEEALDSYADNIANAASHNLTDYTNQYKSELEALGTILNGNRSWTVDSDEDPLWLSAEYLGTNTDMEKYNVTLNDFIAAWVNLKAAEIALLDAITKAVEKKADDADEKAGSKRRNFVAQPIPPYDIGDTWSNATYNDGVTVYKDDYLVCICAKTKDEDFDIDDWQPTSYGTTSRFEKLDNEILLEVRNRTEAVEDVVARLDLYVTYDNLGNAISGITISADMIELNGITISHLSSDLYGLIDGKAKSEDLAALETEVQTSLNSLNGTILSLRNDVDAKASLTALNQAIQDLENQLEGKVDGEVDTNLGKAVIGGYTLIVNGYIQTQFIKTEDLVLERLRATDGSSTYRLDSSGFRIYNASDILVADLTAYGNYAYLGLRNSLYETTVFPNGITIGDTSQGVTLNVTNGIALYGGNSIHRFAIGDFGSEMLGLYDFVTVSSSSVTMPKSSLYPGKVIFVKCATDVTFKPYSGDSLISWSGTSSGNLEGESGWALFFISNGSGSWYAFNCH